MSSSLYALLKRRNGSKPSCQEPQTHRGKITTRTNVLKIHTAMRSHLVLLDLQDLIKSATLKLVPELPINTIITAMSIRILITNLLILSLRELVEIIM